MKYSRKSLVVFSIQMMIAGMPFAWAQTQETTSTGVRYARLSGVSGDVQIQPVNDVEPRDADINMPFLEGDRLVTLSDGSAELIVDDGSVVWLWADSKIDMSQLAFQNDGTSQITKARLWIGNIVCRFRDSAHPASVHALQIGETQITSTTTALFHASIIPDQSVRIHVLSGEIRLESGDDSQILTEGSVRGRPTGETTWREMAVDMDPVFRDWVLERDKLLRGEYRNDMMLPPDATDKVAGLERDGRWVFNSYLSMWCWTPFVSVEWAPYRFGYWDYIPGWGWTWIPNEPWGWVVYHYGYWAYYYEFGWMWVPHWRWGPHWAAWRYSGRSVHWVPIHPEDRLDASGRLVEGIEPRNSRLQIGIPVESVSELDALPSGALEQSSGSQTNGSWRNNPPVEMRTAPGKLEERVIRPVPDRQGPVSSGTWRGIPSDLNRNDLSSRKKPGSVKPGQTSPQLRKPTPSKSPGLETLPRSNKKDARSMVPAYIEPAKQFVKPGKSANGFWSAVSKVLSTSAKSVQKNAAKAAKSAPGLLSK